MTIFYDIVKLEREAGNNNEKFLALLKFHWNKKLPKSKFSKYTPLPSLYGASYLLNPEPLFTINSVDSPYKIQYIKLAAKRDYTLYKTNGILYLPVSYIPEVNLELIKTNPLLNITKTTINFKYEK